MRKPTTPRPETTATSLQLSAWTSSSLNISRVQGSSNDADSIATTAGRSSGPMSRVTTSMLDLRLSVAIGPRISHLGDVDIGVGTAHVDGLHRFRRARTAG